jgi:hypothetical protein
MRVGVAAIVATMLVVAAPANAGGWLPHPADATWTYQWTDSLYSPDPTTETVTIDKKVTGAGFAFDWTNADPSKPDTPATDTGTVWFQDTNAGLFNPQPGWSSSVPPSQFPTLCATLTQCGKSLASAFYNVIWGSRAPVLFEPLLQNEEWDFDRRLPERRHRLVLVEHGRDPEAVADRLREVRGVAAGRRARGLAQGRRVAG